MCVCVVCEYPCVCATPPVTDMNRDRDKETKDRYEDMDMDRDREMGRETGIRERDIDMDRETGRQGQG